ncbi:MAG: hypothetical protein KTR31_23435 [Myxococcales bacterium]|nr:hypothetical protein [Myxococcales bacterium]
MSWLWWASLAWGLDGRDGVLLPGASALAAGDGHVGLMGGAVFQPGVFGAADNGQAAGVSLGLGITDRVAVFGRVAGTRWVEGVVPGEPTAPPQLGAFSLVAVRVNLVQRDTIDLGLLVSQTAFWERPIRGNVGLGFALNAGNERVRFDLSVPGALAARASSVDGEYGLRSAWLANGLEIGVTWYVGEHHRLRAGLPVFTWGIYGDHWYLDLSASVLLVINGAAAQVGVRF